jgi:hypothetical protein
VAVLKPGRILYIADAHDLEDRAERVQRVLAAVLGYVGEIVDNTSYVAPVGLVDGKYLMGRISDLAGDVAGAISNAADDLAARRVWRCPARETATRIPPASPSPAPMT